MLLYDGGCRFCRAIATAVAACDRRRAIAFLPFSDPDAAPFLAPLHPDRREASMHVALPDGSLASAGDALIQLCRAVPGGDRVARLLARSVAARRASGALYWSVASRRETLSRCVPDLPPPLRRPRTD